MLNISTLTHTHIQPKRRMESEWQQQWQQKNCILVSCCVRMCFFCVYVERLLRLLAYFIRFTRIKVHRREYHLLLALALFIYLFLVVFSSYFFVSVR